MSMRFEIPTVKRIGNQWAVQWPGRSAVEVDDAGFHRIVRALPPKAQAMLLERVARQIARPTTQTAQTQAATGGGCHSRPATPVISAAVCTCCAIIPSQKPPRDGLAPNHTESTMNDDDAIYTNTITIFTGEKFVFYWIELPCHPHQLTATRNVN